MSFSQEQKATIIDQSVKASCCRRAILQGIVVARGRLDADNVYISVDSAETAQFIKDLVLEVYSKEAQNVVSSLGGRRKIVSFSAKSVVKYLN